MTTAALRNPGVQAGIAAALLFGAGTPLAKVLLGEVSPWMLAGLLYLGSGLGLTMYRIVRRPPRAKLARREVLPLAGAILFGGMLGPVLLLLGLSHMPATGASLLLNAEGVATVLLAWAVFREHIDRRVALGMVAIMSGAVVLSIPQGGSDFGQLWPGLAVLAACVCWGLDNNLTRLVAENDATWIATLKGLVAGSVNLSLALIVGASLPPAATVGAAMVVGLLAYGVSLVLFIVSMRHLGTARAGAYFSVAPFFGALVALALGETLTTKLVIAAALMALGVWLHLSEDHEHEHTHEAMTHEHWHAHDEHHEHEHNGTLAPGKRHRHEHHHEESIGSHPHYPDIHHRHSHGGE